VKPWQTRSRRSLLELRPWVTVEEHVVVLPDGSTIDGWPWLELPDYAIVVAVTDAGSFLVFRQRKYGVEGLTLSPPGGYLDPGEDAATAAGRELLEETGYEAGRWTSLGQYVVDGNRGCGMGHLYLARDARRVAEADADDLEEQELLLLSRAEVEAALLRGEFKVLSWAAAVALALVRIDADG
jgi:ADP-ribose pyrophosphatase